MRELTETEREKVFTKLQIYIGDNIENMLSDRKLYLNNMRVFLCTEEVYKACSQIGRKQLICVGTIIGKFTKTDNFKITITGAHELAKHGINRVTLLDTGEMNYLYGNNALRSHISKVSEAIPQHAGVFVYNKNETLLGFGLMAVNSNSFQKARSGDIIILNQADCGEYIRNETNIA